VAGGSGVFRQTLLGGFDGKSGGAKARSCFRLVEHSLDGVRAKLDRAAQHLDALNGEFDLFMKNDPDVPWGLVVELNHDAGECRFTWRQETPTPLRWAVVLGEFLYDVRSSLDHLARQLVLVNGRKPDNRTEFPVFHTENDFEGRSCAKTCGMSAEVKAVIEDLQPFRAWPEHPRSTTLWQIHSLCNTDKHRLLNLTSPWMFTARINAIGPGLAWVKEPPKSGRLPLHDKAMIASFKWDTTSESNVEMDFAFTFDVALAEGQWASESGEPSKGMAVRNLMGVCLDYMNTTTLPAFEPFFDAATQS
jgi:hypothetical protein